MTSGSIEITHNTLKRRLHVGRLLILSGEHITNFGLPYYVMAYGWFLSAHLKLYKSENIRD